MSEQENQIGQSKTFEVAGRLLHLKPLSLGRMKRATMIFGDKTIGNLDAIASYLFAILDNADNKDLTQEWIAENVTLPQANEMIDASRQINGLGSFFPKAPTAPEVPSPKEERLLSEITPTPSA
jgi:hypothetical protein